MRVLTFDTETTGMVLHKEPHTHPGQPRLVQLAALLQEAGKDIACFSTLITPDGWTIPEEVQKIHGITDEDCVRLGVPISLALDVFMCLVFRCDQINAHNLSFDRKVMCAEIHRAGLDPDEAFRTTLRDHPSYDTMTATTPICKIPGPRGHKWPKLIEAYRHFFNESFDGAHDALNDVRACARIYWHLNPPAPEGETV